jgi:hypothetical protein
VRTFRPTLISRTDVSQQDFVKVKRAKTVGFDWYRSKWNASIVSAVSTLKRASVYYNLFLEDDALSPLHLNFVTEYDTRMVQENK